MKKTFLTLFMSMSIISAAVAQEKITITHPSPKTSHFGLAAQAFKKAVEELTGGKYEVVIQRLDNEREALESVQLGSQEFSITTTGPAGNFVPEIRVFDIPFLFRDRNHAHAVLDGTTGQSILAKFSKIGLTGMAFGENGFRHLTTGSKNIASPADLKGLKIRTMENPLHIEAWRSVGVLPTPMAFSELPTALQQGTVDGQENPIPVILSNNFDQLQSNLYLTSHVYSPGVIVGFPGFLNDLSQIDRAAFEKAAMKTAQTSREKVASDEAAGISVLKKRGMNVVSVDRNDFLNAMSDATDKFEQQFGADILTAIKETKAQ